MERKIRKTELPIVSWKNLKVEWLFWLWWVFGIQMILISAMLGYVCICLFLFCLFGLFHSETLQCFSSWMFVLSCLLLGWPVLSLTSWVPNNLLKISEVISRLFWRIYLIPDNPPYSVPCANHRWHFCKKKCHSHSAPAKIPVLLCQSISNIILLWTIEMLCSLFLIWNTSYNSSQILQGEV